LNAIRKELDERKLDFDQLRAERDSAKNLLEAERQHGERIRAELTLAREQLAMAQRARLVTPQLVQPRAVRIAPAPRGSAVGVAAPAR
jgi:hypothetical protein